MKPFKPVMLKTFLDGLTLFQTEIGTILAADG